jgi:chromosome segregation ATPase
MQNRVVQKHIFLTALLVIFALCLIEVGAQTRKKRRTRRTQKPVITNPTITPADKTGSTSEEKIISSGDENPSQYEGTANSETRKAGSQKKTLTEQEQMQETITTLSNQVNKLTDKLSQMQDDQRSLLDMERLTRAEQRAETLRNQLTDVQAKEADLQAKLEQLEYALKPENIERVVSMYGTVHPEDAREAHRRQLEAEKLRTQNQLNQVTMSRTRLESAIATADAEVDRLRQKLEKNSADGGNQTEKTTEDTTVPAAVPTPQPSPAKKPYPDF